MTKLLTESHAPGNLVAKGDGTYPVVLISPGRGSSGYYSETLIESYAPQAWPKGTHVYLDHLKEGETRSPEKLLGTLIEETTVDESGNAVNRFKPLSKHAEWIEEIAPFVGLSISAQGTGKPGTIDGEPAYVVETLDPHVTNTVDIVSYAGRGGKFLESFLEEANASENPGSQVQESGATKGNGTMTLEEQVAALLVSVGALVQKIDARESAEADAAAVVPEVKAQVAEAVEATRKVAEAEISASLKATLNEGILNGEYDVDAAIAKDVAYREEIRAELAAAGTHVEEEVTRLPAALTESLGSSAAGGTSTADPYAIAGWGK
jgi:hypothetical protein